MLKEKDTFKAEEKRATRKKATVRKVSHKKPSQKKGSINNSATVRPKDSFSHEIDRFVSQIESLSKAIDPTMKTMTDVFNKSLNVIDKFIKEKEIMKVDKDGSEVFRIKHTDFQKFKRNIKELSSSAIAVRNIPRIFLCSLVHQYDAYLGRLLRVAFYVKSELLSASNKKLSFSDLMSFSSINDAIESIIEKEVESVIRESHVSQFEWMESRFVIPLRKDLPKWPLFVEITERRNLFVHCDGIVSSQYLAVCNKQGVVFEKPLKVGEQLDVDEEYFNKAFDNIFEIGVKLGHVLWRKLQPDAITEADKALHSIGYDLLVEERYTLSKDILTFAVNTLKKKSSDEIRRMNLINLAIANKFLGEDEQCMHILQSEDWSACRDGFKLAVAVLENRYCDAVNIMNRIGTKGEVTSEHYSTWPLFKDFRQSKKFLDAYQSLFGEEFILPEEGEIDTELKNKTTKRSSLRKKPRA